MVTFDFDQLAKMIREAELRVPVRRQAAISRFILSHSQLAFEMMTLLELKALNANMPQLQKTLDHMEKVILNNFQSTFGVPWPLPPQEEKP